MKQIKLYIKNILFLIGEDKKKIPLVFLVFLLSPLIEMIGLGLIGPFIAIILSPEKINETYLSSFFYLLDSEKDYKQVVISLCLLLAAVFVIKSFLSVLNNWIIEDFNLKRQFRLQTALMRTYQNMSYLKYVSKNSVDYIESIGNLVGTYCGVLTSFLRILSETIIIVGIVIFLTFINFKILLSISILLITIVYMYDRFFKKKMNEYGKIVSDSQKNIYKGINEGILGLKEIRMLGKNNFFLEMVESNAKKLYFYNIRSNLIQIAPRYIIEVFLICFIISLIIIYLILGKSLEELVPTLTVFAFASVRLIPSANIISRSILTMRLGYFATNKLFEDFADLKNKTLPDNFLEQNFENKVEKKIENFEKLEVRDISFKYPSSKNNAINKLSFTFKKGETIGFMGPSGSGKTTLVDIILGLLKPNDGEILINNQNLISENSWNLQVAYLPQDIFLLDESIETNITFKRNKSEIDLKKLNNALSDAQLKDFINSLPEGTDTIVGENGIKISGGQKQRLAIARAFYHGRDVLIMDEATSSLDYETENEIIEIIKKIKHNKTIIVIAHRLSTLKHCDVIYEIKNGHLKNIGKYKDI